MATIVNCISSLDFVRAILEYKANDSTNYLFASLFMHVDENDVDRDVETLTEMLKDQNFNEKSLFLITNSGSSDIVNLNSKYILPMDFNIRVQGLNDNIEALTAKVEYLTSVCKGRKFDLARLADDSIQVFETNITTILPNSYLGTVLTTNDDAHIKTLIGSTPLTSLVTGSKVYYQFGTALMTATYNSAGSGTFTPVATAISASFTAYKVSLAFSVATFSDTDSLNGDTIVTFGIAGRATIVDSTVGLGNDLVKVEISIDGGSNYYEIEPTDFNAGLGVSDNARQTWLSGLLPFTQITGTEPQISYSITKDFSSKLSMNLWHYGRYGTFYPVGNANYLATLIPNTKVKVKETYAQFGTIEVNEYVGKLLEHSVSNTESDVLSTSFKVKVLSSEVES